MHFATRNVVIVSSTWEAGLAIYWAVYQPDDAVTIALPHEAVQAFMDDPPDVVLVDMRHNAGVYLATRLLIGQDSPGLGPQIVIITGFDRLAKWVELPEGWQISTMGEIRHLLA